MKAAFEEGLGLLADDIRYWMPSMSSRYGASSKASHATRSGPAGASGIARRERGLALLDETKDSLARRVARLDSGMAWVGGAAIPHLSFHRQRDGCESDTNAELIVHSNPILYRTRAELERDFYVGSRQDVLRAADGSWKIAYRKILVPQNVLAAKNVSSFF